MPSVILNSYHKYQPDGHALPPGPHHGCEQSPHVSECESGYDCGDVSGQCPHGSARVCAHVCVGESEAALVADRGCVGECDLGCGDVIVGGCVLHLREGVHGCAHRRPQPLHPRGDAASTVQR